MDLEELKLRRRRAAHRRRRIIFNNDGNDVLHCEDGTREAFLEARTTGLAGTHVDTISYCTTCSGGFNRFSHNTKVAEFDLIRRQDMEDKVTAKFIEQGTDALGVMVDWCRKNGIEIFWSLRMNDTHDANAEWKVSRLKRDHPEYLLGSLGERQKYGRHTSVDYGRKEIRDQAFRIIEEVCENYDVDGVELDFFRHPIFFGAQALGREASPKDLEAMTDLMRRIRRMTEEVAVKRGRPLLVTVRVPDSVECCAAIGLDIVRWMEEDLIDILAASGYFRLNPWEVTVALGHKYGVPIYACLSESRVAGESGLIRKTPECYRARAMNAWAAGADGIYVFNSWDPHSAFWRELGDPEVLAGTDKIYCTGARDGTERRTHTMPMWLANGERFLNRKLLSPDRPRSLEAGETCAVQLRVGEPVGQAKAGVTTPDVKLRLQVENLTDAQEISVTLNGEDLGPGTESESWLEYPVDPPLVKNGMNRFDILLKPDSAAKAVLQDLLLYVGQK